MSKGVNEDDLYLSGMSIPEVSEETGIPKSTLRFRLKKKGILRSREEGIKNASERGRLGAGLRGKKRVFTEAHCKAIKEARRRWGQENAKGTAVKPSGYIEYTRGPHKGRSVHVVKMEERIGRRLKKDEVVHHIDGDRQNNDEDNLALCTRSGHMRLHRFEEQISGIERRRNKDGTWS